MIRLLVTGGRFYGRIAPDVPLRRRDRAERIAKAERVALYERLDAIHAEHGIAVLIHGDASGADERAKAWAEWRGVPHLPFPSMLNVLDAPGAVIRYRLGKPYNAAAGPARNARMLEEGKPDAFTAFAGGWGTVDMVSRCRAINLREI